MSRIAVIGGGISGLASAHRLIELAAAGAMPLRVALFEAGPRPGGVIHTKTLADCLVELGSDSFITNKPWAVDLCHRLGLDDRLISTDSRYRQALVLRNGKPVPVPDGFMLMAPAKVWPILASPIFSPLGKLRMGLERWSRPARTRGTRAWPRSSAGGSGARHSTGWFSRSLPASTRPILKN
jgi:oxygen-dependent protoporphyrinogen oxidase